MPNRSVNLFINLSLQNLGNLSSKKKESHIEFLTDDDFHATEQSVKNVTLPKIQ